MLILGIESSCDETACSIVEDGSRILSNVIFSQIKDHASFGGIVPELASRKHLEYINDVIDKAFEEASCHYKDIDAVAVVYKPGLIGSLLIGLQTAKAFAFEYSCPLIPVNHIQAHLYAPHLENKIPFPNIGVVISGGHTLIFHSESHTKHNLLGSTIDDAIGEAFDKVAKHFNLGYPGGPIIDKMAKHGNKNAYLFPMPKFKRTNKESNYKLSYSGLKSGVIHQSDKFKQAGVKAELEDILASFQKVAFDILLTNVERALDKFSINELIITGGVACNSYLRSLFMDKDNKRKAVFPSPILSTDNAAMVAGLAYHLREEEIDLSKLSPIPKIIKQGVPL